MNTRERAEEWTRKHSENPVMVNAVSIIRDLLAELGERECQTTALKQVVSERDKAIADDTAYIKTMTDKLKAAWAECERLGKENEHLKYMINDAMQTYYEGENSRSIQEAIRQTAEGCIEAIKDACVTIPPQYALEAIRAKYLK